MNERKYGVWCCVSGGITGHRESWLKDKDGHEFSGSKEEAEKEAMELNAIPRRSLASFSYTVRERY